MNITREELIALCDDGVVPVDKWSNRDSASAQKQLGEARALLAAGCDFDVIDDRGRLKSDDRTLWVEIIYPGFQAFEWGHSERAHWDDDTYYLPTRQRLDDNAGRDWY